MRPRRCAAAFLSKHSMKPDVLTAKFGYRAKVKTAFFPHLTQRYGDSPQLPRAHSDVFSAGSPASSSSKSNENNAANNFSYIMGASSLSLASLSSKKKTTGRKWYNFPFYATYKTRSEDFKKTFNSDERLVCGESSVD